MSELQEWVPAMVVHINKLLLEFNYGLFGDPAALGRLGASVALWPTCVPCGHFSWAQLLAAFVVAGSPFGFVVCGVRRGEGPCVLGQL